jgi:hypothetical protein
VASGGGRVKLPDGRLVVVDLALCRKITHSSRNSIHPAPFTVEQFEELKNLVPGHCRIKGCYNFYSFHNVTHPGSYGQEGHEVVGDICSFHRVYPDHHYDIMEEFGLNTPPPDNTAIERYNQQIIQKLDDFHQRAFALCERADELFAFLMSVGAENDPEATNKINQIFFPQPLPTLKEKLAGDAGDVAKKNNNQAIETQNPQIIQN